MLTICALYKFTRLDDFKEIQGPLKIFLESLNIRGTLLLAKEGVNAVSYTHLTLPTNREV